MAGSMIYMHQLVIAVWPRNVICMFRMHAARVILAQNETLVLSTSRLALETLRWIHPENAALLAKTEWTPQAVIPHNSSRMVVGNPSPTGWPSQALLHSILLPGRIASSWWPSSFSPVPFLVLIFFQTETCDLWILQVVDLIVQIDHLILWLWPVEPTLRSKKSFVEGTCSFQALIRVRGKVEK